MKRLVLLTIGILSFIFGINSSVYALGWYEGTYVNSYGDDTITIYQVAEEGIMADLQVTCQDGERFEFEAIPFFYCDDEEEAEFDDGGDYKLRIQLENNGLALSGTIASSEVQEFYYLDNSASNNALQGLGKSTSAVNAGWELGEYTSSDKMVITITEISESGVVLDFEVDKDIYFEGLSFYFDDASKKTASFSELEDETWEITINEGKIYFVEKTKDGDMTAVFIRPDVLSNMSDPEMAKYAIDSFYAKPLKYDSSKYPAALAAKREKLYNFLADYKSGKLNKCYITSKGGKLQESIKETEYVYYGDMKNNMPDGYGIVCTNDMYGIDEVFAGEFKKGKPSGYGVVYKTEISKYRKIYEGEKCDFSVLITTLRFNASGTGAIYEDGLVPYSYGPYSNEPSILYEGKLDKNDREGKGKEYDSLRHTLVYEGEFKNDEYSGKGILYYDDGITKKYEGEFKDGKYHGKGTLYNKDGSVKHKGKFKKGDIA